VRYFYAYPENHLLVSHVSEASGLTRYLYDDNSNLVALERAGARYFVATDLVGTPRLIVGASGNLVRRIDRDAFGRVLADTNSAFPLDIGFAGGLASRATPLVRFGFRDYHPATGRWIARDPILFKGEDLNLFVYVTNDPVNRRDPLGLAGVGVSGYAGLGGGIHLANANGVSSICAEYGFGLGAGLDLDPFGTKVETDGWKLIEEIGAEWGPCRAKVTYIADECGHNPGILFEPEEHRFEGQVGCGPFAIKNDGTKLAQDKLAKEAFDDWKKDWGGGLGSKLGGKWAMRQCIRF
jgi:RHS repeat-associated protein